MKPTHEPEEAEQTLLPDAPATAASAANIPARPAKPASVNGDTPAHPAAADATVDLPSAALTPPPVVGPDETIAHSSGSVGVNGADTHGGVEATMLPSSASTGGAPGTIAGSSADP